MSQNADYVRVEIERGQTRDDVADTLRRVADQIQDGYSAGIGPRFELHAPQIDAIWDAHIDSSRTEDE